MKLKKILSLALSGILAVSMLAGCGGFGGGAGNSIKGATNDVRKAMNAELDTLHQEAVDYKTDGSLSNGTSAIARTLTDTEVKGANKDGVIIGNKDSSAAQMMSRYVDYDHWTDSFGNYTASGDDMVFATALLFDGSMSEAEVGKAMAAQVAKWDLKNDATYTFDGSIAAYKVTIDPADEKADDISVWFVGLMLEQDKKA